MESGFNKLSNEIKINTQKQKLSTYEEKVSRERQRLDELHLVENILHSKNFKTDPFYLLFCLSIVS